MNIKNSDSVNVYAVDVLRPGYYTGHILLNGVKS